MLQITIPGYEWFDEANSSFGSTKDTSLQLEHSLVSVYEWEQKWNKPFLGKGPKTLEECIDYVRCMTLTRNVDPNVYRGLTSENFDQVNAYIEAPMTATWFNEKNHIKPNREVVTAEVIYYWMISLNIPFECRKWHLNSLLTLIRVCNIKNAPQKKRSKCEMMDQRTALNKARRARMNSKG